MAVSATTPLNLDPDVNERVQRLAETRHRSTDWLMREAVKQYLDREESREFVRRDAMAAWEAYQADGLHATGEDVDAWLAKLEAGEDVPPPECHD
jgi:predicted transcriptional regulator